MENKISSRVLMELKCQRCSFFTENYLVYRTHLLKEHSCSCGLNCISVKTFKIKIELTFKNLNNEIVFSDSLNNENEIKKFIDLKFKPLVFPDLISYYNRTFIVIIFCIFSKIY
jgi:hypothetical protein